MIDRRRDRFLGVGSVRPLAASVRVPSYGLMYGHGGLPSV